MGHTFQSNLTPEILSTVNNKQFLSNISWVPTFLINNDNSGPYMELPSVSTDPYDYSLDKVVSAIALLPPEVTNFAEEVESNVIHMMSKWEKGLETKDLVFRTYLLSSNHFLADLASNKTNMPIELKKQYRIISMPKYIWITEISTVEYINKPNAQDRKIIGEFITDSTANPYDEQKIFLAMRFKKDLVIYNFENNKLDGSELPDDSIYTGLVRN